MNPNDPNLALVEEVAALLGPLCDRVILVGGCAAGFLITDPAQPRIRATDDVDLIVEAVVLSDYYAMEREFETRGFKHDQTEGAPICRWRVGNSLVDLMATDNSVLGFANRWYTHTATTAWRAVLPSGATVRVIDGPSFIATKLVAFNDRGRDDYLASHDMEDVIAVIDGRTELHQELVAAQPDLREFVAKRFKALLTEPRFLQALPGYLHPDAASQARLPLLEAALKRIADLA